MELNKNLKKINEFKQLLEKAEFVLIGAGAGFSAAAGLLYSGDRFDNNFSEYRKKYGMTDMYTAGFYPFKTEEEKWGYWAKHIDFNRYKFEENGLYKRLFELVKDKEYFIITTNVDSLFEKSGFSREKIFEFQGNYGEFQCSVGCHDKVYDNYDIIEKMVSNIDEDLKIPENLVPKCPVCGENMTTHLRIDMNFVQDKRWYDSMEEYKRFLNRMNRVLNKSLKENDEKFVLLIELGVGFNTPTIIRYPFEKMTYENENIRLIRFNRDYPDGLKENAEKTISFTEDIGKVMIDLWEK